MEKSIIATGKTLDLAIEAALRQLGMDRDSVSVEVIENAKSGFLGIGAAPAKVKVTYEAPDEGPAPALSAASRTRPRNVNAPLTETAPAAPVAAPKAAQPIAERPKTVQPKAEGRPAEPRREPKPAPRREQRPDVPKAAPIAYTPPQPDSPEERIEVFIKGLLEHMGSDAVPHAVKTGDDAYMVDLIGEDLGTLIGRRGETLDAIQHLTNYSINRDASKRARISVDAEHYRLKREESLQRLAFKVAGKVAKYRRNITLEPMNAYERHVIHAALQDTPDITTFSTGTEPNRRIVVSYSRDKVVGNIAEAAETQVRSEE
ncbi:MAG: RNA-binding cell elongation regulator Jag/EloR [Oscillospiraceae bacterium]|nr:RNA-binding cell elongation regulator Jag/EloR [Oscillospiraceae bacterium]